MYVFLFYLSALLATCLYLSLCGGRTGRWLAAVQFAMAALSAAASWHTPIAIVQPRMIVIDLVSLVLKSAIALSSTRRWPIWVAAFQLNTVLAQVAILLADEYRKPFLYGAATIWAMPALFVMAAGLALDRRWERRTAH